jgi:superfamily II RNA helicase
MRKKYLKGYYKADLRIEDDERVLDLNRKIESVSGELREVPCDGCYRFPLCHRGKSNHFTKLAYETNQVSKSFEESRSYLWNKFSCHLDFLILNGFAGKAGRLTDDGIWASKLRLNQPLIIAELIRNGLLNELTPELLSGIIAVFVNDKFRDIDINQSVQWNKKPLLKAYYKMKDEIEEIISLKKKHNFEVPQIQFWPAAALYTWACGESWENVIQLTSVDEGDLAMMIFRTADNLRQIKSLDKTHPELASKAEKCIGLLLREPVVVPT